MSWQPALERWLAAGLVDPETAARIREFEGRRPQTGMRLLPVLTLVLGGMLLGAGLLLLVSTHWDSLSPIERVVIAAGTVGALHVAGAVTAARFAAFSATMHAVGTVALGGAVIVAGEVFHMGGLWSRGMLLWAIGSWLGVWLVRGWPQVAAAAILTPVWIGSEWMMQRTRWELEASGALLSIMLAYLGANTRGPSHWRTCLAWIGGVALIPLGMLAPLLRSTALDPVGVAAGLAIGGVAAWILRRDALWLPPAIVAVTLGYLLLIAARWEAGVYGWAALTAALIVAWGVRERRVERINLGLAAFAVAVLFFYVSNVMDSIGRSVSLIGLGVLFLAGGWQLERFRRHLVAGVREERR